MNNNEQLIRRMEVFNNTIIREERGYVYPGYATCELATFAKRTFLAGKRLVIYIYSHPRTSGLPKYIILMHIR